MTITELYDPRSVLLPNPEAGMGDFIDQLREDCGYIIRAIDWIARKVLGVDLIMELIEPISGDFRTIESMRMGWLNVQASLQAVGDNYDGLSSQVPAVWEGAASAAATDRLRSVSAQHRDQAEGSGLIAEQMGHIVEVSKATAETVAAGLRFINDILTEIAIDAALPVVGWAKAVATAGPKIRRCWQLINQGLSAIQRLIDLVKTATTVLKWANAGLASLNLALGFANDVGHTQLGSLTDETSQRTFAT